MKEKISEQNKVLTVIGIVLCVILVPILIVNCTLIVKSMINKDEVPTFAGVLPLIVLTDSMYPEIKSGDVIVCYSVEADDVEVGQVISFFDRFLQLLVHLLRKAFLHHMVVEDV